MKSLIAFDIGTTNCKLVITDPRGKVLFTAKESYPSHETPEGAHEQDPEQIRAAFLKLLDTAGTETDLATARFACFSAAMHSLIPVSSEGKALAPMMTWADTRSNAVAIALRDTEAGQTIYQATGTPIHPMSPLCKIAWLRESNPGLYNSTHKFISIKEYLWFHLFGEFEIDHSIASATGLLDLRSRAWYQPALDAAGISAEKLSRLVPVGHTRKKDGLDFIIGASDGALANLGTGAIQPGEVALTIGTSAAVRIISREPLQDAGGRLFNYIVDEDHFLCGGASNNGGIALRWFVDSFYPDKKDTDLNILLQEAAAVAPGADGLIFLPYIYGERAPVWDASAAGLFFGIHSRHNRASFLRAVLEGICFGLKQLLEAIVDNGAGIQVVLASGGFTASPVWLEILSGILGKPVRLAQDADASAMGAIFLGMKETGMVESLEATGSLLDERTVADPVAGEAAAYGRNYAIFSRLYGKLRDEFHQG